jgi:hypothetical protein
MNDTSNDASTDRSCDIYKRQWAELSKVKAGDRLFADEGFTCMSAGEVKYVRRDHEGQLFVPCRDGKHYLVGQREGDVLVGFYTFRPR